MSDELHVSTDELRRLGASFSAHAYDLGRHLADFRRRTDVEARPGGTGPTESISYEELSELAETAGRMAGLLQDRLDELGSGIRTVARTTDSVYEEFAERVRGVR